MNFSTVVGMIAGIALVVFAVLHSTDKISIFVDIPGMAIVFGGMVSASLVSYPGRELFRISKVLFIIFKSDSLNLTNTVLRIEKLSTTLSREGIDALEENVSKIKQPFLKDGIEMIIDQIHPEEIAAIMDRRIEFTFEREIQEVKLLRNLAKMAPSLGMVGTTVGLVTMMTNLSSGGFDKIGVSLATALTTTFYGLVLAHLVFTPLANRLETRAEERVVEMRLITEGILLLAKRVPPSLVLSRLQAYLPQRMWTRNLGGASSSEP